MLLRVFLCSANMKSLGYIFWVLSISHQLYFSSLQLVYEHALALAVLGFGLDLGNSLVQKEVENARILNCSYMNRRAAEKKAKAHTLRHPIFVPNWCKILLLVRYHCGRCDPSQHNLKVSGVRVVSISVW